MPQRQSHVEWVGFYPALGLIFCGIALLNPLLSTFEHHPSAYALLVLLPEPALGTLFAALGLLGLVVTVSDRWPLFRLFACSVISGVYAWGAVNFFVTIPWALIGSLMATLSIAAAHAVSRERRGWRRGRKLLG